MLPRGDGDQRDRDERAPPLSKLVRASAPLAFRVCGDAGVRDDPAGHDAVVDAERQAELTHCTQTGGFEEIGERSRQLGVPDACPEALRDVVGQAVRTPEHAQVRPVGLGDHDPSGRPEHPCELGKRRRRIGDVLEHALGPDSVERVRRKRQRCGVAPHETHTTLRRAPLRLGDHDRAGVQPDDLAPGHDQLAECAYVVTEPTADVEDPVTRPCDQEVPQMPLERREIVRGGVQVVDRRGRARRVDVRELRERCHAT